MPFEEGDAAVVVVVEPGFGSFDELEELLGAFCAGQFGAALFCFDPEQCVAAVGVDGQFQAFLLDEGKGMDDGQEFSDVVCAVDRAEMEDSLPCGQVNALVFHGAGVT